MNTQRWFFTGLLVVGIGFGIYFVFFNPESQEPAETPSRFLTSQVRDMCEEQIKNRLFTPASAQFADDGRPDWFSITGRWVWRVDVDSQNSTGALLRSRWRCTVSDTSGSITVYNLE